MNENEIIQFLEMVRRVPSPHNTQPFQWKISGSKISMLVDSTRILHESDKELRDLHLSAGAAYEICDLALKKLGIKILHQERFQVEMQREGTQIYLELETERSSKEIASEVKTIMSRACYRGTFDIPRKPLELKNDHVILIQDQDQKKKIATLYDEALACFMSQKNYSSELWQWLRLSKSHPRYFKDGLNAESLRLNAVLAFLSSFIMKPQVLKILGLLGILKFIISEAPQNNSAEGIFLLTSDGSKDFFETGREMYQLWLQLEDEGRCFCPITSLIDDKKFERELAQIAGTQKQIVHVLRYGPKKEVLPLTPRLSVDEIKSF